jgi:Tol biopolymer transport system component
LSPQSAQVRAALEAVLGCRLFQRAPRAAQLLSYLFERVVARDPDGLKETMVGMEVFRRPPGYDTQADPIVRVSVRRLRSMLRQYYEGEGQDAPLRIELPTGGYVPEFRFKPPAPAAPRNPVEIRLPAGSQGCSTHPSLSPDGEAIAFDWRGPGDAAECIYVQSLDADAPARFSRHPGRELRPAWSPNGSQLAHLHDPGEGRFEVHVLPVFGIGDRTVAEILAGPGEPPKIDWSPGGKVLLTSDRNSPEAPSALALIAVETGERWPITSPPADSRGDDEAVFSPRGDLVAFRRRDASGADGLWLLPLAEPAKMRKLDFANCGIGGLAWAPDGASLIVSGRRGRGPESLWRIPLDRSEPVFLTQAGMPALWPAVSGKAHSLAYVRPFLESSIWKAGARDPAAARPLIESRGLNCCPRFSPDGKRIAFRSSRGGSEEIWVCDSDGGAPFRLTSLEGALPGCPQWSPDGSYLVFDAHRPHGSEALVVASGGGPVRRLEQTTHPALEPPAAGPSVSPDGNSVLSTHPDRAENHILLLAVIP